MHLTSHMIQVSTARPLTAILMAGLLMVTRVILIHLLQMAQTTRWKMGMIQTFLQMEQTKI